MSLNTLHFDSLPDDALVRMPIPLILTGEKKTQFYKKMKDGKIPRPVHLGERSQIQPALRRGLRKDRLLSLRIMPFQRMVPDQRTASGDV